MSGREDVPERMEEFDGSDFAGLNFESGFESILEQGPSSSSVGVSFDGQQSSSNQFFGHCPRCDKYRSDLERLDKEHRVNFQFLKKKIISTDLLIRRCKAKTDESEAQCKTIENLNNRLEQADRDSVILAEQLKSAVANMKPLKDEKEHLENMLKAKSSEVNELQIRLAAEEAYKCQRQALDCEVRKWENDTADYNRKVQALERRKQELLAKSEKLTREKTAISSEKNIIAKRMLLFGKALQQAQEIVNAQWRKLQLNGLTDGDSKPYVMPSRYKTFIANMHSGVCEGDKNGQKQEIDQTMEGLFDPILDLGEISEDELSSSEELEGSKEKKIGKKKGVGKKGNKKKDKGSDEKEEEESDGNLSDVSILSHIDDDFGREKKTGMLSQVNSDRKSLGFESVSGPGSCIVKAADGGSTGISGGVGEREKQSEPVKPPLKASRIFSKDPSPQKPLVKRKNFDRKWDEGVDEKSKIRGAVLMKDKRRQEVTEATKGREEKVVNRSAMKKNVNINDEHSSDSDGVEKETDKKQNSFPSLAKAPQKNKLTVLEKANEGKAVSSSVSRQMPSREANMTSTTYAKSSAIRRIKKNKRKGDSEAVDDSDLLSSMSETSDEEKDDVKRNDKMPPSIKINDTSSSLLETGNSEGEGTTGLLAGHKSLLSCDVGNDEEEEEENEPMLSMPFTNSMSDDEGQDRVKGGTSSKGGSVREKKPMESLTKAQLQTMLMLSPMCQMLSPLPLSPCPSLLSKDSDDDDDENGMSDEEGNAIYDGGDDNSVTSNTMAEGSVRDSYKTVMCSTGAVVDAGGDNDVIENRTSNKDDSKTGGVDKNPQLPCKERKLSKEKSNASSTADNKETGKGDLKGDLSLSSNESDSESKSIQLSEQSSGGSHTLKVSSGIDKNVSASRKTSIKSKKKMSRGDHEKGLNVGSDKVKKGKGMNSKLKTVASKSVVEEDDDLSSLSSMSSSSEDESGKCENETKVQKQLAELNSLEGQSVSGITLKAGRDDFDSVMCGEAAGAIIDGKASSVAVDSVDELNSLSLCAKNEMSKSSESEKTEMARNNEDSTAVQQKSKELTVVSNNSVDIQGTDPSLDGCVESKDDDGVGDDEKDNVDVNRKGDVDLSKKDYNVDFSKNGDDVDLGVIDNVNVNKKEYVDVNRKEDIDQSDVDDHVDGSKKDDGDLSKNDEDGSKKHDDVDENRMDNEGDESENEEDAVVHSEENLEKSISAEDDKNDQTTPKLIASTTPMFTPTTKRVVPSTSRRGVRESASVVTKKRKDISKEFVESTSSDEDTVEKNDSAKKCKVEEKATEHTVLSPTVKNNDGKDKGKKPVNLISPTRITRSLSRSNSISPRTLSKSPVIANHPRKGSSGVDWTISDNTSMNIDHQKVKTKNSNDDQVASHSSSEELSSVLKGNGKVTTETSAKDKISPIDPKASHRLLGTQGVEFEKGVSRKSQMECAAQQLAKMIAKAKAGNAKKGNGSVLRTNKVGQEVPKTATALSMMEARPVTRMSTRRTCQSGSQEGVSNAVKVKSSLSDSVHDHGLSSGNDSVVISPRGAAKALPCAKKDIVKGPITASGKPEAMEPEIRSKTVSEESAICDGTNVGNKPQVVSEEKEVVGKRKDQEKGEKEMSEDLCDNRDDGDAKLRYCDKEEKFVKRRTRSQSLRSSINLNDSNNLQTRDAIEDDRLENTGKETAQLLVQEQRLPGNWSKHLKNSGVPEEDSKTYCDDKDANMLKKDIENTVTCDDGEPTSEDRSGRRRTRSQKVDDVSQHEGVRTRRSSIRGSLNDSQGFIVNTESVDDLHDSSITTGDVQRHKRDAVFNETCDSGRGAEVCKGSSEANKKENNATTMVDPTAEIQSDKESDKISNVFEVSVEGENADTESRDYSKKSGSLAELSERKDGDEATSKNGVETGNKNNSVIKKRNQQTLVTSENSAFSRVGLSSNQVKTISPLNFPPSVAAPSCFQPKLLTSSVGPSPGVQKNGRDQTNTTLIDSHQSKGTKNTVKKTSKTTLGKHIPPLHQTFILSAESVESNANKPSDGIESPCSPLQNEGLNPAEPLEIITPLDKSSSLIARGSSPSLSVPSSTSSPSTTRLVSTTPGVSNQLAQNVSEKPFSEILRDMVNFFKVSPLLSPFSSPSSSPSSLSVESLMEASARPLLSPSSSLASPLNLEETARHQTCGVTTRRQLSTRASTRQGQQQSSSDSQMMMQAKKLLSAKRKATAMGKTSSNNDSPAAIKRSKQIVQNVSDADGGDGGNNRGRGKSMQTISFSGFSSLQDAIDYSLRHFLSQDQKRSSPGVQSTIDDINARVKGGNVGEVWLCLVNRTILHLRRFGPRKSSSLERLCLSEVQSSGDQTCLEPLEQSVLDLMLAFLGRHQDVVDKSVLMGSIWSAIFDRSLMSTGVRLSLCRLFCGLCKTFGDLEQARVLLYNIAWCGYLHFSSCLLSITEVWPAIIPPSPSKDSAPQHSSPPICRVFHLVMYMELEEDSQFVGEILSAVECLSGWRVKCHQAPTPTNLLKTLLDSMVEASGTAKGDLYGYTKAVELLCMVQGPAWTQEHFVRKALVGVFQRWSMTSTMSVHADAMAAFLKVTKAVLAVHSFSETTVKILGGQVLGKVAVTKLDSLPLTICFGEIMMDLCPLDSKLIPEFLRIWEETNQGRLPSPVLAQLADTRQCINTAVADNQKTRGGDGVGKNGAKKTNKKTKNQKQKKGKK